MEGSYWLKIGAIVAMIVGSLYILAPTIVQVVEGPQAALEKKASEGGETPSARAELEVEFTAVDASLAEATAAAFEKRLRDSQVAIDRVVAEGATVTVHLAPGGRREVVEQQAAVAFADGGLPTELKRKIEERRETAAPTGPTKPKVFPEWFVAALPDTAMNLGLDLQGGVDLTLQVELDEAIMSEVGRDAKALEKAAQDDKRKIDSVHRDPVEAMLRIKSAEQLADLQKWVEGRARYTYVATDAETGEHLFLMNDDQQQAVADQATEQVLETLRKRVDAIGVKEPSIVKKGAGRIGIQLPGEVDVKQARAAIGTTAVLDFRLVDQQFDPSLLAKIMADAEAALPADQLHDATILNRWLHETGRLAPDRVVLWERDDQDGNNAINTIALFDEVRLTGNDVADAGVAWDPMQVPYVTLDFKSRGAKEFCDITTANIKKSFSIVLDNEIRSVATINDRICGGSARINLGDVGSAELLEEAKTLALVLRTGSLNAPVSVGELRSVSATLGHDAIRAGSLGAVIGSSLVFVFMFVWYRTSGLVAVITLAMNVLLMMAILAMFGATLTLPGITGIALTVGMQVDANIIIFERIREELRLGANARKAVEAGFENSFSAIMDGNITNMIAGIVLFSYGTGPIKGFAVTMCIGIIANFVTALFVNRTLMEGLTRSSTARLSI